MTPCTSCCRVVAKLEAIDKKTGVTVLESEVVGRVIDVNGQTGGLQSMADALGPAAVAAVSRFAPQAEAAVRKLLDPALKIMSAAPWVGPLCVGIVQLLDQIDLARAQKDNCANLRRITLAVVETLKASKDSFCGPQPVVVDQMRETLGEACQYVSAFSSKGLFLRLWDAKGDDQAFARLAKDLLDQTTLLTSRAVIDTQQGMHELLKKFQGSEKEQETFRQLVAEAGGLDRVLANEELQDQVLRQLSIGEQVIISKVDSAAAGVEKVESNLMFMLDKMTSLKRHVIDSSDRVRDAELHVPQSMQPPLKGWWHRHVHSTDTSWRGMRVLLEEHMPNLSAILRKIPCITCSEPFELNSEDFIELVMRPMLDTDQDDRVTAQELHVLSVRCRGWKRRYGGQLQTWDSVEPDSLQWIVTVTRQARNQA